ncbi:hypothetical protein BD324DRAFT_615952 [Kockovaella imperatae]|uniref:RRN7-type domain-containing protein n=1 Tax=Kockovaella imperatae TaxID=4999 RepID=A0A1Y1UR11_9TREE|nr:hypothetical protein BD324DRAFT_615952 [Kockovaella imperatae]ORX40017.1 hypothetical protein BD324DRAFT_615952 [Kockovaella imperatae]
MPKPCPVCGSKKWRKDAVSGSAICEDGHVFQDFRSENLVVESSAYALQRRSLKKGPRRNKRREKGDVNRKYYWGDDAEYLKIQALQLLLRLQVQALKPMWSLPDAFEQVVKELWAYQLAIAPLPSLPTDLGNKANGRTGGQEDERILGDDAKSVGSENDSATEGESELDTEVDDAALEAEMMAQLSSDSSFESDVSHNTRRGRSTQKHRWKRRRGLQIQDTLVTLGVAFWILRIPLLSADLESLINLNRIPYIDYGYTNLIPENMKSHMNRELRQALSPRSSPRPVLLHKHCSVFARVLIRHFHVVIPEANISLLAWRLLYTLGGTPTTYCQVMNLLALLDVNLYLTFRRATKVIRKSSQTARPDTPDITYERRSLYDDVWLPEVSVASALIIVMKMTYGLDDALRPVMTWTDPVVGLPHHEEWIKELEGLLASASLSGESNQQTRPDFTAMDVDEIDRYLDVSQNILLKDHEMPEDPMFPLPLSKNALPDLAPHPGIFRHWTQGDLTEPSSAPTNVPNKDLPLLPAEQLRMYDADDLAGTLPRSYDVLLQSCAAITGVDSCHLAKCVQVFERRLERIRAERVAREHLHSRAKSLSRRNSGVGQPRRSVSSADLRGTSTEIDNGSASAM